MSPPPRRRSARLAGVIPKPKSAPELSSVAEHDATTLARNVPTSLDVVVSPASTPVRQRPVTPVSSSLKPPRNEMHPSKTHLTTGKPDVALRLGFSDVPTHNDGHAAGLTATPSKVAGLPSSPFTFRFSRQVTDSTLSGEARRMMDEIRSKAVKIKEDLVAQREAEEPPAVGERVIAIPKGKSGRYSAAHMTEFKKMDSIENHASAWRAQNGRFSPVKSSLKRSPSKASLDATPTAPASALKPCPPRMETSQRPKSGLKRTSSVANLGYGPQGEEPKVTGIPTAVARPLSAVKDVRNLPSIKRHKKREEDDASTSRPVARGDGGAESLPKPRSGLARLMSPTKASMAHAAGLKKATGSLPSPSKINAPAPTATASKITVGSVLGSMDTRRRMVSPRHFQKAKSILRGQRLDTDSPRSAIPQPVPQAPPGPGPLRNGGDLPPLPLTTPRRKLSKRVAFTPEAADPVTPQESPSRKKLASALGRSPLRAITRYPAVDEVSSGSQPQDNPYPDLSPLKRMMTPQAAAVKDGSASVPGKFTFRTDHTIKFGDAPAEGFGASPGQAGLRHVRGSIMPLTSIPGSFPAPPSPSSHPDKENTVPSPNRVLPGTAHGLANKKRHRANTDEEDADEEAASRAAKKRKNENVPEGQALLAPRFMAAAAAAAATAAHSAKKIDLDRTPIKPRGWSASPSKKGPLLSMSRLNMLARPKKRG
ncbi:hypothetical protein DCS_01331 [Drechmeria coniospora]|uniref:Erythromycin esterase n=1 Tax=Drechmeria coniospora TaxID=98403 RepID=A0A151GSW3_DRECN|nr:hypothetical protein DCS_01331 [Drechmeria coniospora]KYK60195.1 hypothetical protein DCS_01331 [Drechmeria coniospora]ODA80138.1 hypothetical protein RJ55_03096 [Drechmeria coniospora]